MAQKSIFYYIRKSLKNPETNRVISQDQYAKFLGFDKSTICINEKQGHNPSLQFAYAVSKTTGISLDYIARKILEPYTPDPEIMQYFDYNKMKKFHHKYMITGV